MALTALEVSKSKATDKPQRLADGGNMYLLVQPNGAKYWRMDYRLAGKRKTLAIGVYPDMSLAEARDRREQARKLIANGVDPVAVKQAQKVAFVAQSENSFEVIAREWFAKHSPNWKENHSSKILARLENDMFPWVGVRPIGEINAPALLAAIRRIEARGALETAHRVLAICGQVFRYAVATGRAERDPTGDLRGALLLANGLKLSGGTIVDATIVSAPSSTKNKEKARDPEMHQTKKGNQWYFGMKVHIGVDSKSGLTHSVSVTPANVHDSQELPNLLHGDETRLYGDSAYANQKEKIKEAAPKAKDFTNKRAFRNKPLSDADKETNRRKSSVRAKVEHPFRPFKNLYGFAKARYRGLLKNANRAFALLALINLEKWGRPLTVC